MDVLRMIKFKVFQELNDGHEKLEVEVNKFFKDRPECTLLHMNTVVETVDKIDYKSIIICYE
jgi:hypothetical protein